MKLFHDTKGQEWKLELNIGSAKVINERLRDEQVDLLKPNTLIHRLADPFFTAMVLYIFVKDQADAIGVDADQFGSRLGGLVLWEAQQKLMEEYIDFFPNPKVQENLRAMMQKTEEYSKRVRDKINDRVVAIDAEFDVAMAEMEKAMDKQIDQAMKMFGESSTKLPEPPESATLTDTPLRCRTKISAIRLGGSVSKSVRLHSHMTHLGSIAHSE